MDGLKSEDDAGRNNGFVDRYLLTLAEFCWRFSIGRTRAFELINLGELPFRNIGRRLVISTAEAEAWASSLPLAAAKRKKSSLS